MGLMPPDSSDFVKVTLWFHCFLDSFLIKRCKQIGSQVTLYSHALIRIAFVEGDFVRCNAKHEVGWHPLWNMHLACHFGAALLIVLTASVFLHAYKDVCALHLLRFAMVNTQHSLVKIPLLKGDLYFRTF